MFETSVQEKRAGLPWGIMIACATFAVLLGVGYVLIT